MQLTVAYMSNVARELKFGGKKNAKLQPEIEGKKIMNSHS